MSHAVRKYLLIFTIIFAINELSAITFNQWAGGTSGSWNTAKNWSTGSVPGIEGIIEIDELATITISEDSYVNQMAVYQASSITSLGSTASSLTIGSYYSPAGITALGILTLDFSGGIVLTDTTQIEPQSTSSEIWTLCAISGGHSIEKLGAGTWYCVGAATYTGGTTISAGTMEIDGSITSSVTVDSDAILSGVGGTVTGNVTVEGSGILAPGSGLDTAGTLTISGNLTMHSNGILYIPVTSSLDSGTATSELVVTGTAGVTGGKLEIAFEDSTDYSMGTFVVLTAGTLSETFSSITTNLDNSSSGITVTTFQSGTSVGFILCTGQKIS